MTKLLDIMNQLFHRPKEKTMTEFSAQELRDIMNQFGVLLGQQHVSESRKLLGTSRVQVFLELLRIESTLERPDDEEIDIPELVHEARHIVGLLMAEQSEKEYEGVDAIFESEEPEKK